MVQTFHDGKAPAVPAEVEGDVVLQKQTPTGEAPAVLTDVWKMMGEGELRL